MDSPKATQQSSLDSLRTVEFRQTLRGYHIDDVDEYLERVAVEADALQEQLRQANERVKQAADRIAQLEESLEEASQRSEELPEREAPVSDDALQRTLLLAQKFVDQTQAEAEAQARVVVDEAEERARHMIEDAENKARSLADNSERKLREEVGRLEGMRAKLSDDVERISRHLDAERGRLRTALSEMLSWIDKNIQPDSPQGAGRDDERSDARSHATNGPQSHGFSSEQERDSDRERDSAHSAANGGGLH